MSECVRCTTAKLDQLPLCIKFTHRISPPGHQEPAVSTGSRSNHPSGMEHWISALTKPRPLGFSVLVCSLTFTKQKEIQLYQCLITPLMLPLQWKSIKIRIIVTTDLQRFPEQNKGDTRPTAVQETPLFNLCKDSPCLELGLTGHKLQTCCLSCEQLQTKSYIPP